MDDNDLTVVLLANFQRLVQRTHHLYVNVVPACEIFYLEISYPPLSSNLTRDKGLRFSRTSIHSHGLFRSRVWKTSVGDAVALDPLNLNAHRRGISGSLFRSTSITRGRRGARFRDAGTKVPLLSATMRASRRATSRNASRTRRDRTPKGVTALSVARATDDRPAEGECP